MNPFISFVKSHKLLCAVFALLFCAVAVIAVLIAVELNRQQIAPEDLGEIFGHETETAADTAAVTEPESETEPVTEAPVPYYDAEGDSAYYPSVHATDYYKPVYTYDENYRIYAASPQTNDEDFNAYCAATVSSLITSMSTETTAREGGTTVVTIDYTLYLTKNVYSAVFTQKLTDKITGNTTKSVIVRIYNIETDAVYAPLDRYDMTLASEPLAVMIREGYEAAFDRCGLRADSAFLDEVCTPDPSSFVNIAVDADNMYFFTVYNGSVIPELLCATVSFDAMTQYTWEAIEAERQAQLLPEPEDEIIYIELPTYDLSGAVPESEAVSDDYFDDALFIGNSLIVGLQKTVPLNARYFATIGLNVSQVLSKELIPLTDGSTVTISDAIDLVEFKKVYLMFGVNELGWGSITSFIDYYGKIIDRIREVNPEALIYVQSILPVNEEKWAKSRDYQSCINNYAVATFNQKIVEMCRDKAVYFVNVAEVLTDETGNLFEDATSDGIHISGVFSTRWVEYLKTHTVTLQ